MENETYLTIKAAGTYTQIIKKSEFICSLARTETEAEAKAFINQIQAANKKANHNCFAYTLGLNDEIQRESDNGEPSGTAGVPILEVLKNLQLHNVTAVVTRYFGGIKLGASGLIRAYAGTTSQAIMEIGIVKRVMQRELAVQIAYNQQGRLENYLKQNNYPIMSTDYGVDVTINIAVDLDQIPTTKAALVDLLNGQVTITSKDSFYNEIPYQPHQDEK